MSAGRTDHVLAAIDGALKDWSVGPDAMRWAPEPPARGKPTSLVLHPRVPEHPGAWHVLADRHGQVLLVDWAVLERSLRGVFTAMAEAAQQACEVFRRLGESLAEAGHHPVQPPSSPQRRALWLRQHRNTGPARPGPQQGRRPRRHNL